MTSGKPAWLNVDLKNTVLAKGVHCVSHHKHTVTRVVKGRPYGRAGLGLATALKGDRRKEWHSPDRAGRQNQAAAAAKGKKALQKQRLAKISEPAVCMIKKRFKFEKKRKL